MQKNQNICTPPAKKKKAKKKPVSKKKQAKRASMPPPIITSFSAVRARISRRRTSPAQKKAWTVRGKVINNERKGYKLLEKKDLEKILGPGWKVNVRLLADKIIKYIMKHEGVSRIEARKILAEENYFAGRNFSKREQHRVRDFTMRYSFRDRKYYWKRG